MKLNYYGYHFEKIKTGEKILANIEVVFRQFCAYKNSKLKNQFSHNGEQLFFLNLQGNLYLFLQTKSQEIIKKVNSQSISVTEITDMLQKGEMIGFASYVLVEKNYLGFATTLLAPRANAFVDFVNSILGKIHLDQYQFKITPLLDMATREEVLQLPFIGRSTIEVGKDNSLYEHIVNIFQGTANEFANVDSFELILKPRKGKDISTAAKKVLKITDDNELDKMLFRAKEDLHGALIDIYLAGRGIISDVIDTKDENVIAITMREKTDKNTVLKEKLKEYIENEAYTEKSIDGLAKFADASAWADSFSHI